MLPMMTGFQQEIQQAGGTWSALFSRSAAINTQPLVTILVWYAVIWVIGSSFYPLTRVIFAGLRDKGWGSSRFFGLLTLSLTVWLAVQSGASFSAQTIWTALIGWIVFNAILFLRSPKTILDELRSNRRQIQAAELVFAGLFLFFLFIRLGNPDLWHPYKGGEKPMDFSYFNAVIKSSILPPYDPWFNGGTLNYYYYGFFVSGLLTKALGVIPSIAYNLILPSWFAFLGVSVYEIGSTVYGAFRPNEREGASVKAGLLSVFMVQMIGNLGTFGILGKELIELGAQVSPVTDAASSSVKAFFSGFLQLFRGQRFHLYPGDWYWIPSRAIPGEPITEFPYFTFLYGDPHAHLFALPMTALGLAWLVSLARFSPEPRKTRFMRWIVTLIGGGVMLGSLIPTNTWDFPTYFTAATVALGLVNWGVNPGGARSMARKAGIFIFSTALLALTAIGLFYPYFLTNTRESAIQRWSGDRTPTGSYLMHWGIFLFAVVTWYVFETVDWLQGVKLSSFRRFYPKIRSVVYALSLMFVLVLVFFAATGVEVGVIALPLMIWTLFLMIRPKTSVLKRLVFFFLGTAFFITLFVEFTALAGDIGRMNMVFKLYNQAWILMSIGASVGLAQAILSFETQAKTSNTFDSSVRTLWSVGLMILLSGGVLFTITASADKVTDRMVRSAPHTLDGMAYMDTATYSQDGFEMDLSQDANAIRFLQDTVVGSPTIVEGHATEYKWGNRMTIYTGLPSVIGWNYHQRQQRTMMHEAVWARVDDVKAFYETSDRDAANAFLTKYGVRYIIVGQLERGLYPGAGLEKFEAGDGQDWFKVFRDRETVIYEVKHD